MALKNIANENMTIEIVTPGVTGTISLVSTPSTKVKADGVGVYRGSLQFGVSNIQQSPCGTASPGSVASASISPTTSKVKADGQLVLREGDKVTGLSAVGATQPGTPSPIPCTIIFDVEITNAGQSKVKAE